jgi:hypothetical protein
VGSWKQSLSTILYFSGKGNWRLLFRRCRALIMDVMVRQIFTSFLRQQRKTMKDILLHTNPSYFVQIWSTLLHPTKNWDTETEIPTQRWDTVSLNICDNNEHCDKNECCDKNEYCDKNCKCVTTTNICVTANMCDNYEYLWQLRIYLKSSFRTWAVKMTGKASKI